MQILVVRHGESEDETIDVHEPLTIRGIEQSKKMSKHVLEKFPPEFIWSSTLIRASKTAEILADIVGCPVRYLDELREQNNNESDLTFYERVKQIFDYVKENSKQYKRIAIITHGGTITKIIEIFLQIPTRNNVWFHTDNTGIHLLDYHPKANVVRFTNYTNHLT